MTRPRGQAMAEFAVFALLVTTFGGGLVIVARLQSLQRQALLAAREAVFCDAWSPRPPGSAARPDAALRERHLGSPGWTDPAGQRALAEPASFAVRHTVTEPPGEAARLLAVLAAPLAQPGGFRTTAFGLGDPGFHRSDVRVAVARLPGWPPFDALDLTVDARAAILGNPWSAAGPAQVRDRAAGLVPLARLEAPLTVLRPFLVALSVFEPDLRHFCPGIIDPERVPADRLQPVPLPPSPTVCP